MLRTVHRWPLLPGGEHRTGRLPGGYVHAGAWRVQQHQLHAVPGQREKIGDAICAVRCANDTAVINDSQQRNRLLKGEAGDVEAVCG